MSVAAAFRTGLALYGQRRRQLSELRRRALGLRRRPLGLRRRPSGPVARAIGLCAWLVLPLLVLAAAGPAEALQPIAVTPDQDRIEITALGVLHESRGDTLHIEAVAGVTGAAGRMSVRAVTPGTNPSWLTFALTNPTDKQIERWLTAERYTVVGSGVIWPDLDARRIEAVTPSIGFVPERIKSDRADIFRITLEPGQTITYVAELSSERFARIHLWKPLDYELKVRDRQLFNGIMLGLTGLLAIFLTAVFAANHKAIFPAAALVAWSVLVYLCVDFGFFHKLFQLRPDDNAVYRAAAESAMAASLVIFLYVFLRLTSSHGLLRMLATVWIVAQLALVAVSVVDPRLAATFARASFAVIGALGGLFTLYLALRNQDRALSLVPTWLLFLVWIFAAGVTLTGRLSGDIVVASLVAGLVLIVVLIGFTVTQFAFRSIEPIYGSAPSTIQLRSMALDGAGAAIWEWNARRDEVKVSAEVEASLGLQPGELNVKVEEFAKHLHLADRERFKLMLWSIQERSGGKIRTDFRLRHADNTYRWFELDAATAPGADRRQIRCVGLIRDVTESKRAYERLMHDAVHCTLTGLPNREILLDRLGVAMTRAKAEQAVRPTVILVDIDKFRSINQSLGLVVGDSLLLTVARRLQRHLGAADTLARVGGDQFAILMIEEQEPRALASLAERVRRSLRSPIKIAGQEIVLTGALGIAVYDGEEEGVHDLLKEAEMAMFRAKRGGADKIEVFKPEMRSERDDRITIESDLRRAIEKKELRVLYQPLIYLPTEELAGFEALVRWEHPRKGMMNPASFVPIAEESDLIVKLGSFVLMKAAQDCAKWQRELPRPDGQKLFVSVNVSSRQLFRQDLIQEIRHILGRNMVPKGSLKLEVTESLVMENPEQATEILELLRGAGAELALDDFGTGYSSLAYLQKFPFDTIKIDRSLIQASGEGDSGGAAIVRSMVALSHELGKKVVAEGVEAAEDVGFLRSIGCEYAQGFYYGEPMPEREVMALLKLVRTSERKMQPRGFFRTTMKKRKEKDKQRGGDEAAANAAQGQAQTQDQTQNQGQPPMAASEPVSGAPAGGVVAGAPGAYDPGAAAMRAPSGNGPPSPPPAPGAMSPPLPPRPAPVAGRPVAGLPRSTMRPRARPPHPSANGAGGPPPVPPNVPLAVPPSSSSGAPYANGGTANGLPPMANGAPPGTASGPGGGPMVAPPSMPAGMPPGMPAPAASGSLLDMLRSDVPNSDGLRRADGVEVTAPGGPPSAPRTMPPGMPPPLKPHASMPPAGGLAPGQPHHDAVPVSRRELPVQQMGAPTGAPIDLSKLPPGLAASLARIAGRTGPPRGDAPPPPPLPRRKAGGAG